MLAELADTVIAFAKANEGWAAPIVFALAFGESMALIGVLVPATVVLFALGAVIQAGGLDYVPLALAAAAGAAIGDVVSYGLGYHYKRAIATVWPLSRYPDLLPRGERFFAKWGVGAVFMGRFFGPLRASIPLVAGMSAMPQWPFQLANVTSALVWGFGILAPGFVATAWLFGR